MAKKSETPLMKQYNEIKAQVPDSLLFFRLGDFYELFLDDAKVAAKILQIALTSRNKNDPNPIAMCGVPYHSATNYINKLIKAGHKVAICDQLEAPSGKGIVKRGVVRIISPGTQLDPNALDSKLYNYTHAANLDKKTGKVFWATCDFSTGKFWFGNEPSIARWITSAGSQGLTEVILPDTSSGEELYQEWKKHEPQRFAQTVPKFYFDPEYSLTRVLEQFNVKSVDAVHPELGTEARNPVGALIKYFQETQKSPKIPTVTKISKWGSDLAMELDPATIRSLELLPQKNTSKDVSLLQHLDLTKTAMGGRLLRSWMLRPLVDKTEIEQRLDSLACLFEHYDEFQDQLNEIYDLERLAGRISLKSHANARDLRALAKSLFLGKSIAKKAEKFKELKRVFQGTLPKPLLELSQKTLDALKEELPLTVREGGIFQTGYNKDLDELIELTENGERWLAEFEARERKASGIPSLKVKYNRVFGYFIEITKAHLKSAPTHYIRKQTMVNGERYITEELKKFEEKILTSEKKRSDLEYSLFQGLCNEYAELSSDIAKSANALAELDVFCALAKLSDLEKYTRPEFTETTELELKASRHPTVASALKNTDDHAFVPNDVNLTPEKPFLLITGPNMGGKSTVMRQTALITLMAQMGCYVPAKSAKLGIADRIFTRIGANDNIAEGSSTFMVEMSEMSFILRNSTERSLILIDEIGRGTSTYDGMSLAMALAKELALKAKARTLFATHYHELTSLAKDHDSVQNGRMAVSVTTNDKGRASVDFLYRLEPGAAERSYGILVARLAGLPESVLKDAGHILEGLETGNHSFKSDLSDPSQLQLGLGLVASEPNPEPLPAKPSPADEWLKTLDVNQLTPLEALVELSEWVDRVRDSNYNTKDDPEQDVPRTHS